MSDYDMWVNFQNSRNGNQIIIKLLLNVYGIGNAYDVNLTCSLSLLLYRTNIRLSFAKNRD